MNRQAEMTVRKPLRVKLDLTMREAGVLHSILAIVEGGDVQDIRRRNIRLGKIFNKLNAAEDVSLEKGRARRCNVCRRWL